MLKILQGQQLAYLGTISLRACGTDFQLDVWMRAKKIRRSASIVRACAKKIWTGATIVSACAKKFEEVAMAVQPVATAGSMRAWMIQAGALATQKATIADWEVAKKFERVAIAVLMRARKFCRGAKDAQVS